MSQSTRREGRNRWQVLALLVVMGSLAVWGGACGRTLFPGMKQAEHAGAPPGAPGVATDRVALESAPMSMESPVADESMRAGQPPEAALDPNQVRAQQKIIYTGEYRIKVEDAAEASRQVRALAERYGGFVSNLNKETDDSGNTRVTVEIRVPSEKFMAAVSGLEGLGRVELEDISTQNVTEEWVDLEARLDIRRLRKQQLETLLKRATSSEEIDRRQQQIMVVQEEIERIQGRMRYLQDQVVLSTITVRLYEKGLPPLDKPGPFSARNTVEMAWYALLVMARVLFTVAVFLALPGAVIWIPALVIYLVWRARRRTPPGPPQVVPPAG